MITVVDYGLGNVGSVANMFSKIGVRSRIATDAASLQGSEALVLPGVGHFDAGMRKLSEKGYIPALRELVQGKKVPILGICLGMQLFTRRSDEGSEAGLGWLAADTRAFVFPQNEKRVVPHMGWNHADGDERVLFGAFEERPRFYFVHSFHVVCDDVKDVAATASYGINVTAAVRRGNIFGTQFHPEKSHRYGMTLLKSFASAVRSGECSA